MSQNQKLDQISLKSVFHVRRSQNEPPFLACIQLKPYINSLQDKSQYIQIIAPYSKNNNGRLNQIYSQDSYSLNRLNNPNLLQQGLLFSQQNNLNPNYENFEMNKSSDSFDVASYILIFFTLGSSVTALVFYGIILDYISYYRDWYYYGQGIIFTLITFYSIVMFLRVIIHFIICCIKQMSFGQRVSLALSFFCPLLKYHLIKRKSNQFRPSLKAILITDGISTFFLLLTGILSLLSYAFLLAGILFLAQVILQVFGYFLYINFINVRLSQQKKYQNIQQRNNIYERGYLYPQTNRQLYQQNQYIRAQNGVLFAQNKINGSQNSYRQQYP